MAILCPVTKWRPLTRDLPERPLRHDIVCWHTMVGTLEGSWSWSNRIGGTYWHFGVAGDGESWQTCDLAYTSAANLEGNPYVIPIETEDTNAGEFPRPYANPLWTPAQKTKIAQITAWCCARWDIPPTLIPDTRKGRRGIGYHAQGIQGNPAYKGGLNWSKPFNGKTCPNRRITQVPEVIRMVQQILGGTPPEEDEDMAWFRSVTAPQRTARVVTGEGAAAGGNTSTMVASFKKAGYKQEPTLAFTTATDFDNYFRHIAPPSD